MKTTFSKTIYQPNEIAEADVKIHNQECKLNVTQVAFAVEMHVDCRFSVNWSHIYRHAESHVVGPNAGVEDWKHDFKLDLSKIKYEAIKEKKKKG